MMGTARLSNKHWRLAAALILACSATIGAEAQEIADSAQRRDALKHLLRTIRNQPFYALDWHDLKLAVVDAQSATQLKNALEHSGRSVADAREQSLWVDAAAGHPEAALAFYDANILKHPDDKTLPNAACWARAAHGLDLKNALVACNAAVAAAREGYTLVNRGKAELQLGLFEDALRDFNEALGDKKFQSHPMLADAAFGRGIARLRLGDADGRKDIRAATQANSRIAIRFADIGIIP